MKKKKEFANSFFFLFWRFRTYDLDVIKNDSAFNHSRYSAS